jgi:hypothetical protein
MAAMSQAIGTNGASCVNFYPGTVTVVSGKDTAFAINSNFPFTVDKLLVSHLPRLLSTASTVA